MEKADTERIPGIQGGFMWGSMSRSVHTWVEELLTTGEEPLEGL